MAATLSIVLTPENFRLMEDQVATLEQNLPEGSTVTVKSEIEVVCGDFTMRFVEREPTP